MAAEEGFALACGLGQSRVLASTGSQFNTATVRSLYEKKKYEAPTGASYFWQRRKDSNPHKRSQSPVCYLYTTPLKQ